MYIYIYIYIYICNYKSGTQEYTNTYPNICKHIYLTQKRTPPVGARDPALARSWPGPGPGGVLFCVSNIYVCIYLGMYWYIPVYQIYNYIYIYIYIERERERFRKAIFIYAADPLRGGASI